MDDHRRPYVASHTAILEQCEYHLASPEGLIEELKDFPGDTKEEDLLSPVELRSPKPSILTSGEMQRLSGLMTEKQMASLIAHVLDGRPANASVKETEDAIAVAVSAMKLEAAVNGPKATPGIATFKPRADLGQRYPVRIIPDGKIRTPFEIESASTKPGPKASETGERMAKAIMSGDPDALETLATLHTYREKLTAPATPKPAVLQEQARSRTNSIYEEADHDKILSETYSSLEQEKSLMAVRKTELDKKAERLSRQESELLRKERELERREEKLREQENLQEFWRTLSEIDRAIGDGGPKTQSLRTRAARVLKVHLSRKEKQVFEDARSRKGIGIPQLLELVKTAGGTISNGKEAENARADIQKLILQWQTKL